ncbi:hypothetical protein JW805_04980 [Roseomonas aeriglobus]|nr:hypothetical protein [Roseomonas aeriglobus]
MREPGYDIAYDAQERVLHLHLWGFWSVPILTGYTSRLMAEVTRLRGTRYDILSHSQEFDVQGKLVSAGFEWIAKRGAEFHNGRTAIVAGSHLNRIQAQRTLSAPNVKVFLDEGEALAWIREGRAAAA